MDEVTIGEKTYISSKRAAEITGYAKDYVGQLCREGHIEAKMVGRGWYVYEPSIRAHRFGNEAPTEESEEPAEKVSTTWDNPTYTAEEPDYIPEIQTSVPTSSEEIAASKVPEEDETITQMQSAWREWFDARRAVPPDSEIDQQEEDEDIEEISEGPHEAVSEVVELPRETYEDEYIAQRTYEPVAEVVAINRVAEKIIVAPIPVYEEQVEQHSYESQDEVYVPIQRAYTEPELSKERREVLLQEGSIVRERIITRRKVRSNAPAIAIFVAISILSVGIAVIGTGVASNYLLAAIGKTPITEFLVGERTLNNDMK